MHISGFTTGRLQTNNYLFEKDILLLVDCGDDPEKILKEINGRSVEAVLLTHTHFDHVLGLNAVCAALPKHPTIVVHAAEKKFLQNGETNPKGWPDRPELPKIADEYLHEINGDETLSFGGFSIQTFSTPGHSAGSVTYLIDNKALITGDLLFWNSVGRTDLSTGDADQLHESIDTVYSLSDDLRVYPGHGTFGFTLGERKKLPLKHTL